MRTSREPGAWTMEMAIPFRSLRFPEREAQAWGVNIVRVIRRKNEVAVWSPVPRQFREQKVSYAGLLDGLRAVRPGRQVSVKPAVTASVGQPA